MGKDQKLKRSLRGERFFRWRGRDVTRLENLSDIVFALSLTLIVASAVPASFAELQALWREVIAVGMCFALVLLIWSKHHAFFRRYDLEDGITLFLNSAVLFLIMVFAYPLKFLATFLVTFFTFGYASGQDVAAVLTFEQTGMMVTIYAAGYAAVFGVFALLYAHALRRADVLELSEAEKEMTRLEVRQGIASVVISLGAIALAWALPAQLTPFAGGIYFLIGPAMAWLSSRARKRAEAYEADGGAVS